MSPAVVACLMVVVPAAGWWSASRLVRRAQAQRTLADASIGSGVRLLRTGVEPVVNLLRSLGGRLRGDRSLDRLRARAILLEVAARSLRSGAPLLDALRSGSEVAGPGVEEEIRRLEQRVRSGLPVAAALRRWQRECDDADVDRIAVTTLIALDLGGGTADAFESLGRAFSDRHAIAAEARALTSQARASATLLLVFPVFVVTVMAAGDPQVRQALLGTIVGWGCLAGAAVLNLVGIVWMRAMIRSVR